MPTGSGVLPCRAASRTPIGGVTWHSLLGMGIGKAAQVNADTVNEVFAKARTVITDEFSLIPPQFLSKIAQGMGGDAGIPFRGQDMAWYGDFSQLPPVGGDTLCGKSVDVAPPAEVEKPARPHRSGHGGSACARRGNVA